MKLYLLMDSPARYGGGVLSLHFTLEAALLQHRLARRADSSHAWKAYTASLRRRLCFTCRICDAELHEFELPPVGEDPVRALALLALDDDPQAVDAIRDAIR